MQIINKKSSVLIISLWIAAILAVFTFGLAQRAFLSLRIARNQRDMLKAYNLAKAGISKAIFLIEEDSLDTKTKGYDSIKECGVNLKDREPALIFKENFSGPNEGFEIGYYNDNHEYVLGFTDEERAINIYSDSLPALLEKRGIEEPSELASTIRAWVNQESSPDNPTAEIFKKESLNTPEEIMLVLEYFFETKNRLDAAEKAKQQLSEFENFITIYGDRKINVNTVAKETLEVLASSLLMDNDPAINTAALVSKIIELRDKKNYRDITGIAGSFAEDIASVEDLNDEQKFFFNERMAPVLKCSSDFFKICSKGYVGSIIKVITVAYERKTKKTVYWHEN